MHRSYLEYLYPLASPCDAAKKNAKDIAVVYQLPKECVLLMVYAQDIEQTQHYYSNGCCQLFLMIRFRCTNIDVLSFVLIRRSHRRKGEGIYLQDFRFGLNFGLEFGT